MCNPLPGAALRKLPPGRRSWQPALPLERQVTISLSVSDARATRRGQQIADTESKGQKCNYTSFFFFFPFWQRQQWNGLVVGAKERQAEPPKPVCVKVGPTFLPLQQCGGRLLLIALKSGRSVIGIGFLSHQYRNTSTDMHVDGGAKSQVRTDKPPPGLLAFLTQGH